MAFKFGHKKKNNDKEEVKDVKASKKAKAPKKKSGRAARKAASKKRNQVLKNYPYIKGLHIMDVVPEAVLADLKTAASGNSGAVQKVSGGYTVIVATESEFKQSDFEANSKKSAAYGQLAAEMRANRTIKTGTPQKNLMQGQLIIIPDASTLSALSEFDEFKDKASDEHTFQFYWGVFPADVTDEDVDDYEVEVLSGQGVTLGDINRVADGQTPLSMGITADTVGKDDDGYDPDDDDDLDDDDLEPEDDLPDANGAPDDDQGYDPDDDLDDDDDLDYDPNEEPDEDVIPDDAPDPFGDNTSTPEEDVVPDDEPEAPAEDGPIDYDAELAKFEGTDEATEAETAPVQSSEDLAAETKQTVATTLHDTDLGLEVNSDAFDAMFEQTAPYQFELQQVDADDRLGQLANEMRRNVNAQLVSVHNNNYAKLQSMFFARMDNAFPQIQDVYSYDNKDSKYHAKLAAIKDQKKSFDENKADTIAAQVSKKQDEYNEARDKYVEAVKAKAVTEYDNLHHQELEAAKNEIIDTVDNTVEQSYIESKHQLQEDRKRDANQLFNQVTTRILTDLQNSMNSMQQDEQRIFKIAQNKINDKVEELHADETKRAQAVDNKREFDATLAEQEKAAKEAEASLQAEVDKLTDQLQQEREEAEAKRQAEVKAARDEMFERNDEQDQTIKQQRQQITDLQNDRQATLDKQRTEYEGRLEALRESDERKISEARGEGDTKMKGFKTSAIMLVLASLLGAGGIGVTVGSHSVKPVVHTKVVKVPVHEKSNNNDSRPIIIQGGQSSEAKDSSSESKKDDQNKDQANKNQDQNKDQAKGQSSQAQSSSEKK